MKKKWEHLTQYTTEQNKNFISNHILSLRSSLSACTAKCRGIIHTKDVERNVEALYKINIIEELLIIKEE